MPANTIARLVPDQRAAGAEPVTARATLRWPNHPRVVCAADKLADCGHVSIIARGGRGFIHAGAQHAMIGLMPHDPRTEQRVGAIVRED